MKNEFNSSEASRNVPIFAREYLPIFARDIVPVFALQLLSLFTRDFCPGHRAGASPDLSGIPDHSRRFLRSMIVAQDKRGFRNGSGRAFRIRIQTVPSRFPLIGRPRLRLPDVVEIWMNDPENLVFGSRSPDRRFSPQSIRNTKPQTRNS
jgi:hypothetical protein